MDTSHTSNDWWKSAVFYQIYPLSFQDSNGDGIGDISGIISRLPYLSDLGVDALWLSPIQRSPMVDNGYDISDYDQIDPLFGSMYDFERLVTEAHKHNLRIIMDLVINHTSDHHPWFLSSRKDRTNTYADYYIWHDARDGHEPNNWANDFGESAWTWCEHRQQYYLHSFSKNQPDLNWQNPAVEKELTQMMSSWCERGVDGFRIDMGNFFIKADGLPDAPRRSEDARTYIHGEDLYANQRGIHELYQRLHKNVFAPYGVVTIGEMYFLDPVEMMHYTNPEHQEISMVYFYQIMDARGDWTEVKRLMRTWHNQTKDTSPLTLTFSNHDSPRSLPVFGDATHYPLESAKLIHTFLLTAPSVPFLLQGEEIGMTGTDITHADQFTDVKMKALYERRVESGENPHAVFSDLAWWNRDHARTPMQWSAGKNAGFSPATPWLSVNSNYKDINVIKSLTDDDSLLHFIHQLLKLRKKHPTLIHGDFTALHPDDWAMWCARRCDAHGTYYILYNFAGNHSTIGLHRELQDDLDNLELLLGNHSKPSPLQNELTFKPWEVQIFVKKN